MRFAGLLYLSPQPFMCSARVVFLVILATGIEITWPSLRIIGTVEASATNGHGRIHGGERAEDNEFPPTARIRIIPPSWRHRCGASVINREWIMTAAHCLVDEKMGKPETGFIQFAGQYRIVLGNNEERLAAIKLGEQRVNVTRIIIHERWEKYQRQNALDDIALMQVFPPIRFGKYVQPVNLPECNTFEPGQEAWAVGWGWTGGPDTISPFLKKTKVRTITSEECKKRLDEGGYGGYWKIVPETVICVLHEPKTGVCQGDSGSPLYVWKDNKRKLEQIGVLSATANGSDCENGFGIYTRVSSYRGWINRRTSGCGNFRSTRYPLAERSMA